MAGFRLPKVTDEEKAARKAAIAEANIGAAQVPMTTAQAAVQVLELLPEVITYGNVNTLSDCGVATECAHVAGIGALMNVAINLPSIKDEEKKQELEKMRDDAKKGLETAYKNVVGVLALKFDY
jgi:formiminotetrahydrofolate cyclodeaminase